MAKKKAGVLGDIRFSVTLTVLLVAVGVGVAALFFWLDQYRTELTFLTALAGGLTVIHRAYYASRTLNDGLERDKMARTFEIAQQVDDIEMVKLRVFVSQQGLGEKKMSPEDVFKIIVGNEDIHALVRRLLGQFEDASLAVRFGFVDELILYRSLGYLVKWAQKTFGPYIEEQRQRSGARTLYNEFEDLAHAWRAKESLVTKRPLPPRNVAA